MRIALVHYHLQSGGVTSVLLHQQQALSGRGIDTVILTGQPPPFPLTGAVRVIPGLQYEKSRPGISGQDLATQMRDAAEEALGGPADLWHVHNHSLGKNLILPDALDHLARAGEHLLLQIHDFAEDGRPGNYRALLQQYGQDHGRLARLLYPQARHIHYAVLNNRDYLFLHRAGLELRNLHLAPNPISLPHTEGQALPAADPKGKKLWIYPTRAIRRKNIGEFLLWSILGPPGAAFAITAAPENPTERGQHHRWRKLATELRLPVLFADGQQHGASFTTLLQSAACAVTTSMAEGFGMAYLEPWLLSVPVCGRDLPEVTANFRQDGISFPWTYERLDVPVQWIGLEVIRTAAREGLGKTMAAYGYALRSNDLDRVLAAWIKEDRVDFGRLNENMQETVLRTLAGSRWRGEELRPNALPDPAQLIRVAEGNRRILEEYYHLDRYGERLADIYRRVLEDSATSIGSLNGENLLGFFLAPERLSLLRVD